MSQRVFSMSFAKVYPLYIQKAEKKGRSKEEVDRCIFWLTGYDKESLKQQLERDCDFTNFFAQAPQLNPNSNLIKDNTSLCLANHNRHSTNYRNHHYNYCCCG